MEELEKFEGRRILRHTLSPEVYRQLSDAVEDWRIFTQALARIR